MLLWLTSKQGYSGPIRAILQSKLATAGIRPSSVLFNSLHFKAPLLGETDPKKMPNKFAIKQALKVLDEEIRQLKPKLIVVNDQETLRAIVGKKYTLATVRGSLYWYSNIPIIIIDEFKTIRFKTYGAFVFGLDLAKIARWAKGEQHDEPAFDYRLCRTVGEVAFHTAKATNSTMVSSDTETSNGFITCITYTYDDTEGKLVSFVVPFFDPMRENGAYWEEENDEKRVRELLRELNASSVIKAFQNGTYDCAYEILEGFPAINYLVDTQNLMHSLWVEAPKKLHNIASYFVDYYTYWKDDNKGDKDDDKLGWTKNAETVNRYWRYCALDGYYTYLGAVELIKRITKLKWAMRNYSAEFGLSVGPCLAASLRGIKVDRERHGKLVREQSLAYEKGKDDLRRLSGEEDFNINSTNDNAWLLYDVLGAKKTRLQRKGSKLGLRSTDEKVLRLMKEQMNFFVNNAIDRILRAKKPGTWLSKYGDWNELTMNGRFHSWHNAAATETFRLNSGDSQFWHGTNGQNWQPYTQEFLVADDGYILVDCDYSASDDWFIAYESQDETKMEVLASKDVHSYHASRFAKLDYDKIVKGKKNNEEWVVHAITGVRQIFKKFNHGKNFRMGAEMTYNLMGRDMAVATARLMGFTRPEAMSDKELIGMCAEIGRMYDKLYKRVPDWQDEIVTELKENDGLATNAFGITRNFFGSSDDHATQRQLSAYFGQSGTSGNINRALRKIFYAGIDDGKRVLFVIQVHDSLKFLIRRDALAEIKRIKEIMEEPLTLKGRTFHVPVNVECGLTDGKKMLPWRPDITYEEIVAHEHKIYDARFPKGSQALLDELNSINFEDSIIAELEEKLGTFENQEDMSGNGELELASEES